MLARLIGERGRQLAVERRFFLVSVAMLILSLHWAFVLYIHSTYLEQFVSAQTVGWLYALGSAITVVAFLFASRALARFGNYQLTLSLAVAETLILVGMGFAQSPLLIIPLFILHQAIVPLILFCIDVFIENITTSEERTGRKRGIVLVVMSLATALAPLATGLLLRDAPFSSIYYLGAACMVPFVLLVYFFFKRYPDARPPRTEIRAGIAAFLKNRDLRYVFLAHSLLQLFFAWMVIYVPLYLFSVIGLSWDSIGKILFAGLMAYVILEYGVGRIADLYIGEKEMMIAGFLIMALATTWISFVNVSAVIPWMVTMFLTRVGASLVEATTESYFFKHTNGSDAHIIGLFRITRPLSMLLGALLGTLTLAYLPFQNIFIVLGLLMLLGIVFAALLKDTR